jgi:ABC-2 type transport system permease protein
VTRTFAIGRAFLRRDWALARSYRLNFALQILNLVATLGIFFYLGRLVDNSSLRQDLGIESGYFSFAIVGIALLYIVQDVLSAFASRLRVDQSVGTFEAVIATPAPTWLVALGSASYEIMRSTLLSIAMILMAIVFFDLRPTLTAQSLVAYFVAFPALVALFAALGVALAAFTVVFKQAAALSELITAGLALLGGVYFPVSVLPPVVESAANALPFTWGLEALRAGTFGTDVPFGKVALLVGSSAVALPLALALFDAAVRRAKREGSLAQY